MYIYIYTYIALAFTKEIKVNTWSCTHVQYMIIWFRVQDMTNDYRWKVLRVEIFGI